MNSKPKDKKKQVVFYSKGKVHTVVMIPSMNGEGEPLYQRHPNGELKHDNRGYKIPIMKPIEFQPELVNVTQETRGKFVASDPNDIEQLSLLDMDPDSNVVEKERYLKDKNPDAYLFKEKYENQKKLSKELLERLEKVEKRNKG